jgi:hypothetical protein
MSVPVIKTALVAGEVAPSMFGRTDLARMQSAASTMRNSWPHFQGGSRSRAGTACVGFSKQTGRNVPPRLLPFQFNVDQGIALEFGNFYMRVVIDGAFVSDVQAALTGVSRTNPAVIGFSGSGFAAASAVPISNGVSQSYDPGDQITLAGGVAITPTVLSVTNTELVAVGVSSSGTGAAFGSGYAPGDTIDLAGGVQSVLPVVTVNSTLVVAVDLLNAGSGGPPLQTVILSGTTGTGTKFQVSVLLGAIGEIMVVNAIVVAGDYSINPANLSNEPLTGSGVVGAVMSLKMGLGSVTLSNPGVFTTNAPGGNLTQASTSGSGIGATFGFGLFGPNVVTVATPGAYATYPANPVGQASTSGTGAGAAFTVTTTPVAIAPFNNGDWVELSGIEGATVATQLFDVDGNPLDDQFGNELFGPAGAAGATQANGVTAVLANVTTNSAQLFDVYGNPIDGTAWGIYTGGGLAARIYTLPTIYSENDELWLKDVQSADVMSICAVNQITGTEYPPQDLSRLSDTEWVFTPAVPAPTVSPPAGLSLTSTAQPAAPTSLATYQYQVTSVNATDGSESVASNVAGIGDVVDISATAGTITLSWDAVAGVNEYNIYKAFPGISAITSSAPAPPSGSLFGFAGQAYGNQFIDNNVVPDFTQVPPTHQNPFARGQAIGITIATQGHSYTNANVVITSVNGSGAVFEGVVLNGFVVAFIPQDGGSLYQDGDEVTITGDGTGATGTLVVGPESGTYPGTVAYFQERRAYAFTLNNPDTYFMSQPGSYLNFDTRVPPIDTDAITGSPWSVQVNGIQWMIQTPGGLMVFTGLQTWLLVGQGSFATNVGVFAPDSQDANPQPAIGCSPILKPIKVNYDVLFADSNSQYYYDQPYQLYALSEPIDLTEISTHLFTGYNFVSHAWCRNPTKLMWTCRDDGIMLSFTYLKSEEVKGWARHDTQGLFQSNCEVIEPPVDALYVATQRFPPTYSSDNAQNTYFIERMDNRIWPATENVWAVDCGLALAQPTPGATLTASSATGFGSLTGVTSLVGGQNYSAATFARAIDDNGLGPGAGAAPVLTIGAGGVITNVAFGPQGAGYTYPALEFIDPSNAGSGASAAPILDNSMKFTASAAVFSLANVGSFIRMGGGIALITGYIDPEHVTANMLVPITSVIPGSSTPLSAPSGSWTMSAPVTTISGLRYLAGLEVIGLADGNVVGPLLVNGFGQVTLPNPASAVTLGLGFQSQVQGVYLEAGSPTLQGARKKIADVTVRLEASAGVKVGTNQVDGSTLSPPVIAPVWNGLAGIPNKAKSAYNALCQPLWTGDTRVAVFGGFQTPGQVALQQDNPLPMNIMALIPEVEGGDTPQQQWPKKQGKEA